MRRNLNLWIRMMFRLTKRITGKDTFNYNRIYYQLLFHKYCNHANWRLEVNWRKRKLYFSSPELRRSRILFTYTQYFLCQIVIKIMLTRRKMEVKMKQIRYQNYRVSSKEKHFSFMGHSSRHRGEQCSDSSQLMMGMWRINASLPVDRIYWIKWHN